MPTANNYSRVMLTIIAALLVIVAVELGITNYRLTHPISPRLRAAEFSASYQPTPVGLWQPISATAQGQNVLNVRIVGYRYVAEPFPGQRERIQDVNFGWLGQEGLPVITK